MSRASSRLGAKNAPLRGNGAIPSTCWKLHIAHAVRRHPARHAHRLDLVVVDVDERPPIAELGGRVGHTHKPAFMMDWHYEMLREAGLNIGGKHWLVQNGTYKTGPDVYSIRGWSKGVIGVPTLVFSPDQHDVDCFETPLKAVNYMKGMFDV